MTSTNNNFEFSENALFLDGTESTNFLLSEMLRKKTLPEGFLISTDFQTSGKGQQGNSWESEKGSNLLFSILLYPRHISIEKQFILSQLVCLAIKKVLDKYVDEISIKWPNDIYWKNKKLAGILIQNSLQEAFIKNSIIGIGLNVNQTEFLSNAPNPVSLRQIVGKELDRVILLREIYCAIMDSYQKLNEESLALEYRKSLYRGKGFFPFRDGNGSFEAKIYSVHNDGQLELETSEGERRQYYFKEVEFVI